jgi:hypothetical protein
MDHGRRRGGDGDGGGGGGGGDVDRQGTERGGHVRKRVDVLLLVRSDGDSDGGGGGHCCLWEVL